MPESRTGPSPVIHFGDFEFDLQAGQLSNAGTPLHLDEHPLRVLALLVEHPGQIVTREQLRERLWPSGTAGDVDRGLNAVVKHLRDALGDAAERPKFVETVTGRGYRFIAAVDARPTQAAPPVPYRRRVVYASAEAATRDARQRGIGPPTDAPSSSARDDLPVPPETVRYTLLEKIGSGGMGEVFRAHDSRLSREVAIKFLPEWLAEEPKALRRFQREAQAAAALNHPNILNVHDLAVVDGRPCIVTELLDGQTLRRRLEDAPLSLRDVVGLAAQVLSGVAAAHARGIVHRDLKPENLFVTRDGQVKILDFGIVKVAEAAVERRGTTTATGPGEIIGSVGYMSPEQVQGLPVDHRSDIFSLGTVLYEMSTGGRPFSGATQTALVASIIKDTPVPVSAQNTAMPPELSEVVKRCLEKEPEHRYQSVTALRDELLRLAPLPLDGAANRGQRVSRTSGLLAAVLVLVAVMVAVVFWSSRRAASPTAGQAGSARGGASQFSAPSQVTAAPGWETQPALSPDGTLIAYTSNESGNADVWVMPSSGGNAVNVSNNEATDEKPAWFPDNSAVVYTSDRGGGWGVWKAPPLGGGSVLLVADARDPAISPDARQIAFVRPDASGTGRVMVAPLADVSRAQTLVAAPDRIRESEEDPAWSPRGQLICYSSYRSLWVVPSSGGAGRRLTEDREVYIEPVWSADGRWIYFSSLRGGAWALYQVSADGGVPARLTKGAGAERHPTLSRDGARLAFSNFDEDSDIVIHDLRSGREEKTGSTREESSPALSRDGRLLVYARSAGRRPGTELWVQPLSDGRTSGTPYRLSDQPGAVSQPSFSPDGRWVVYQRVLDANRDIWTIPAGGGEPVRITDDPADDLYPVWSPNGDSVAFASTRDGGVHIWVVPVKDGHAAGTARQVTHEAGVQECPAWSPDGRQLAYVGRAPDGPEAFVMASDGSGSPRQITTGAAARWLRWGPAGSGVIVNGTWRAGPLALRMVDPVTLAVTAPNPPVIIGGPSAVDSFNISFDGRLVVFAKPVWSGDLWMMSQSIR